MKLTSSFTFKSYTKDSRNVTSFSIGSTEKRLFQLSKKRKVMGRNNRTSFGGYRFLPYLRGYKKNKTYVVKKYENIS